MFNIDCLGHNMGAEMMQLQGQMFCLRPGTMVCRYLKTTFIIFEHPLMLNPCPFNLFNRLIKWITLRSEGKRAMYSVSVVDKATRDCILDAHTIGHPAYMIMYLVLECAERGTSEEQCCQEPAQPASTKHSKPREESGFNTNPCSLVRRRYQQILLTASSCCLLW